MNIFGSDARKAREAEAAEYYKNPARCPVCNDPLSYGQFKQGRTTCSQYCNSQVLAERRRGRSNPHPTEK